MRVAAAGGGLARLQRCIEARYWRDPGRRVPHRVTKMKVYRLVVRMGLREAICSGEFRAGNMGGDQRGVAVPNVPRRPVGFALVCVCADPGVYVSGLCRREGIGRHESLLVRAQEAGDETEATAPRVDGGSEGGPRKASAARHYLAKCRVTFV